MGLLACWASNIMQERVITSLKGKGDSLMFFSRELFNSSQHGTAQHLGCELKFQFSSSRMVAHSHRLHQWWHTWLSIDVLPQRHAR